jgi:hypothetical protein
MENLGFPLHRETWGFQFGRILRFLIGMKRRVSNRLGCNGGMSWSGDLEITYFVDVSRDENELMWGRM